MSEKDEIDPDIRKKAIERYRVLTRLTGDTAPDEELYEEIKDTLWYKLATIALRMGLTLDEHPAYHTEDDSD